MAFKTAIQDVVDAGNTYLIQTGDISIDGTVDFDSLSQIHTEKSDDRHYLQSGDILLRLRGPKFTAAIFDSKRDKPSIATNQIAVIRLNRDLLEPYYLQWYINLNEGQRYFSSASEGTSISKVNAKTVSDMPITLLSLKEQVTINVIQSNWLAQKAIYRQLILNGDQLFNQLCDGIKHGKLRG